MIKRLLASAALLALGTAAQATVSVTGPAFNYTQNFDSLASTGTNQTWANDSSIAGWSLFKTGVARTSVNVNDGTSSSGGLFGWGSAGTNAVTDRALGGQGSLTFTSGTIAAAFTNNSGAALSGFTLNYDGEQWHTGNTPGPKTLTVQYGFGSSFAAVTNWTATSSAFTFTEPTVSTTAGALDGNAAANRVAGLGGTIASEWAPGATLWVRWDWAWNTGESQVGLAIDNVALSTVAAVPEPGSYALMLAGLGAVGFVARRRGSSSKT